VDEVHVIKNKWDASKMVKCMKKVEEQMDESSISGMLCKQRNSIISLELVGKRCFIHNGRTLVPLRVVKQMVGFRFCSFIPVRKQSRGRVVIIKKKK
jgi:ribosomal protein S19